MLKRYFFTLEIALQAILANKLRSLLTALGIIFGVAAVIAMLAVGNGAQQEILEQIRLVGVNNVVITPVVEQKEEKVEEGEKKPEKKTYSPGLTLADAESIRRLIPEVEKVSPEIMLETAIVKNGVRRSAKLVGVEPAYFELSNFSLQEGKMFNGHQLTHGEQVCIIGKGIQTKFFSKENPVGKTIKCGKHWLTIIGVLNERIISENSISKLGIRDYNMDVYAPLRTVLIRYVNRSLVTERAIQQANNRFGGDGEEDKGAKNYHQIDRLVVQTRQTEYLTPTSEVVARMLQRRHNGKVDYEITIPELLLKQQQRTKDIFNIVLGAIAGISLIVGGIGIMNIMLASVLERIKEIGLRLSLGAKKGDIILQFLFEAIMISVTGGLIGVALGISSAVIISGIANIPTIVTPFSVFLSFCVAAFTGLLFGIAPARRAANQDPITSLRYE
ncbi:MAG: ABC-type antimicrobial peptide transport system, permease component [uncultured Cytophagales bacterium]|uniref:ABC-type antimicrobial peptide transport system, permease component n=1 Tax=uncultured Cytophagales bacterium TaxID=158755 RepID=A0A6J4KWN4_9SPHI|nr:MAG: ABC-type antimicrobial peptide transport system, permease component [uncultured Cytophagales bacterium]